MTTMTTPEERAIEAARDLSAAVNDLHFNAAAFEQEIRRGHRTIQQNTARVIFALIEGWAGDFDKGNYDMRNENTVRACRAIMDEIPDNTMILPHI